MRIIIPPILLVALLLSISGLPAEGSSLPALDPRSGSTLLSELWPERFPDPFRVLEQIPLGFDKDDLLLTPARVDWKETPDSHVIMVDIPGMSVGFNIYIKLYICLYR